MAYHERTNKQAKQTGKHTSKMQTKLEREHKKQTKLKIQQISQIIISDVKKL